MYEPAHEDILTLHNALNSFGEKFLEQQGAERISQFQANLPDDEKEKIERATARIEFNRSSGADLNERMVGLLFNFACLLPGLRREFSDAAVYEALDSSVNRTSVINLCNHVGAREVAQFFRETRGMKPA